MHLRDLFAADPGRGERMKAEACGLYLDYAKHQVTSETIDLLVALAEESGVAERRDAMFRGEHQRDRGPRGAPRRAAHAARRRLVVDGVDVVKEVHRSSAG